MCLLMPHCQGCAATCYLWARHTPLVRTYPVSPCPWVGPYEGTVSMLVCCSCMLPSQHACALPCMLPCQHACALPMLPMRASSLCTLLRCPNHLLHLALLAFMGPRCCPREIPWGLCSACLLRGANGLLPWDFTSYHVPNLELQLFLLFLVN